MMLSKEDVSRGVLETDMNRMRGVAMMSDYKSFEPEVQAFFDSINFVESINKEEQVLELGCGKGETLIHLAKLTGIEGKGIDIAPNMYTKKPEMMDFCFTLTKCKFYEHDFEKLPNTYTEQFDKIFSYAALTYAHDKLKVITEVHKALKIGGTGLIHLHGEPHKGIVPSIDDILTRFPNNGQLEHIEYTSNKQARSLSDNFQYSHHALIIKKEHTNKLIFPGLLITEPGIKEIPASTTCHYKL